MTRKEYRDVYLKSHHWRQMRALALEGADHRCAVCNAAKSLDVHHRTYERIGNERLADLLVLCRQCHELFHKNSNVAAKKKPKRQKVAKAPKAKKRPKATVTVALENERLHAIQKRNKRQRQLVREGVSTPSAFANLAHRTRA